MPNKFEFRLFARAFNPRGGADMCIVSVASSCMLCLDSQSGVDVLAQGKQNSI